MCIDAAAEFADISLGDPWIKGWQAIPELKNGYNLVLARTPRGLKVLEEMQAAGLINLNPLSLSVGLVAQEPMVTKKRLRAFYNVKRRRRVGKHTPEYGISMQCSTSDRLRAAIHSATYFAAARPRLRRRIVNFLLSSPGRLVVGSIFFRRHVIYAFIEKLKRAVSGKDFLKQNL
jgi:hypothetical protein